ncbi:hypothetical protein [Gloeobacter kilaueensis]|uniref:Peptidase n=1 Tax=Gloeobacter kilaueensis (strain ATCC BAA-2537 / CCAP 1431/1 / ULC 316 / JS1) TaxID=1183438 RepID=U5QKS9_GLOK1|nr:hypothetical protein [Gloeobacter kilaueensis]AGY59526.1 peptidase [Gloeobacter kilaueensis JS1]
MSGVKKRLDEQVWFRASAGLAATVALGLVLNWWGPSLVKLPVLGQVFSQLCRVVNATCSERDDAPAKMLPPPPLPPPPAPVATSEGHTLGTAVLVEGLDGDEQSFDGKLERGVKGAFYRIALEQTGTLNLLVDGDAIHAVLLDSNSNPLTETHSTPTGEALQHSLKAGTYYLWIKAKEQRETSYHLSLSVQSIASRREDDTPGTARDIGRLGRSSEKYRDWVGEADPQDFLRFALHRDSTLNLLLDSDAARAVLLDSNGETLATSKRTGIGEAITQPLVAGDYYVRVERLPAQEGNYTLNLSAESPADGAGDN